MLYILLKLHIGVYYRRRLSHIYYFMFLDFFQLLSGCPFQKFRPIEKTVILHSIGYCLLALLGLLFIFTKVFTIVKKAVNRQ